MLPDSTEKARQALADYFEQFKGDEVITGFVVTTGDAIYIAEHCPVCNSSYAQRANYLAISGGTMDIHWRCKNCGQVF